VPAVPIAPADDGPKLTAKVADPGPDAPPVPAEPDTSPAGRLKTIQKDYDAAMRPYYDAVNAAKSEEEFTALQKSTPLPDVAPMHASARALIDEDPTSPVALDALSWLLLRARSEHDRPELFALVEKYHVQNDALAKMLGGLVGDTKDGGREFVTKMMDASRNPKVIGTACYVLAGAKLRDVESAKRVQGAKTDEEKDKMSKRYAERYAMLKELDTDALTKQAEAMIERTAREFADVPYGKSTLGERAGADLFEMHQLVVGKVAPDIEGEDLDGAKFNLADYRGKIVLLDFWGHW
jgi:hypothetical protein